MNGYVDNMKGCPGCDDGKEKENLFKHFNLLSAEGNLRLDELVEKCRDCVDNKKKDISEKNDAHEISENEKKRH